MGPGLGKLAVVSVGLGIAAGTLGCEVTSDADGDEALEPATLSALMDDGDVGAVAPGAMVRPGPMPGPGRFCPNGDCTRAPLAFWKLDDCNPLSTELADSAFSSPIQHPAFRAVSVACTAGVSGQAVKLSGDDAVFRPCR